MGQPPAPDAGPIATQVCTYINDASASKRYDITHGKLYYITSVVTVVLQRKLKRHSRQSLSSCHAIIKVAHLSVLAIINFSTKIGPYP